MEHEELQRTIKETVHETLFQIGISVGDDSSIVEFRKDVNALREWRISMEAIKAKGLLAAVGVIVAGTLAALWVGIKAAVLGHV